MWQYDNSRRGYREQIRVRVDHGHEIFYKKLSKEKLALSDEIAKLESENNKKNKSEINRKKIIPTDIVTGKQLS